ncbi:hypothetical protein AVEN_98448-1 [Araneus ventricosus]|uniref:Uncharacterized protein n=1 Tax=Araneus ventricosus TaxID=182803 RepID=A0A4Y2LCV8_ARAVE|nr:hypothetical protein AVEN_98448-1 [Araneus ventricosus]
MFSYRNVQILAFLTSSDQKRCCIIATSLSSLANGKTKRWEKVRRHGSDSSDGDNHLDQLLPLPTHRRHEKKICFCSSRALALGRVRDRKDGQKPAQVDLGFPLNSASGS